MSQRIRSHGFCYTVNNWTDEDIAAAMSMYEDDTNCKYQIIGFEIAPRKGTPHMQCYIYYTKMLEKSKFEKKILDRFGVNLHSEVQRAKKNVNSYCYCMEDGDWYEQGDRPRQGHRTDLEVIKHDILNGKSEKQISKEYFSQWCQYRRAFSEFRDMHNDDRETVILLYESNHDMYHNMKAFYQNNKGKRIEVVRDVDFNAVIIMAAQRKYDFILFDKFFVPAFHVDEFTTLAEFLMNI